MCPSYKDLNIEFKIRFPTDLRQAIAVTRDNLADGTISEVTTGGNCKPFDELVSSGKWDDVLLYHFKCNTCAQLFELSAETYHGRGGWWKPVDNQSV
jgi:hypothetical protein